MQNIDQNELKIFGQIESLIDKK